MEVSEDRNGGPAAGRADEDSKDHGGGESNGGITNGDDEKKPLPLESFSTKGKGLKKWRRLQRRDIAKEADAATATVPEDVNRFLKRDSSGGSAFALAAAGDSDNSEDPSSKSSTAASAPKFRYHRSNRTPTTTLPTTTTTTRNNFNTSASYSQQQPGPEGRRNNNNHNNNKLETSKKLRGGGGGLKIDKDASYSSGESDLRSSNLFFTEVSNGGRHLSFDVDNSSEAQASDQHSNEYFFKDNGEEEVISQDDDPAADASWGAKEEQSRNQPSSRDLLAESIVLLQVVHQALEKEIKKFGEIGKEPILLPDDLTHQFLMNREFHSVVSEIHETNSSSHAPFEEIEKDSLPLEPEFIEIHCKVETLERKLEEAVTMLEVKASRVVELEGILNERELRKGEPAGSSVQEKCREMETELDDLFKQKIEAEVECLTMRNTCQKLKVASEDQIALFEEQRCLIGEQKKIRDTESNIAEMKKQVHKLASSGEWVDSEEVVKMRSRICKHAFCFSVQLMLLFLAIGLLLMQLWPGSNGFVPT